MNLPDPKDWIESEKRFIDLKPYIHSQVTCTHSTLPNYEVSGTYTLSAYLLEQIKKGHFDCEPVKSIR